jgi:cation diffusion facilitator family transporter
MAAQSSSHTVIYAALAGNLLIAVTKFAAALFTGSSAMLSEAVHSLVDTGNEVLLLYGHYRAGKPADALYPLGHGREIYFWSFVVAVLIFALGAGVSAYEGVQHILDPHPISNAHINYIVLGAAFLFESGSWLVACRAFRAQKGSLPWFQAVRRSKDPTVFLVLFEDSAALIGIVIAAAGTAATEAFGAPVLDGVASLGIAAVLAATAGFLASESKGLLIGESARPELAAAICRIASEQPGVDRANGLFTVHLAPHQVVAGLSLDFADDISAAQVEAAVAAIERRVRAAYPEVEAVLIKPQAADTYRADQGHGLPAMPPPT